MNYKNYSDEALIEMLRSGDAEIADYLGIKGNSDEEKLEGLIKAINDLKARVGIKETIKDYGVDEKDFLDRLDDMVEQAFDDQCTGANPRYPLMSEIKQMYLNAYYGKHFVEDALISDYRADRPDNLTNIATLFTYNRRICCDT